MKRLCKKIQKTLLEGNHSLLTKNEKMQTHLEECNECFALLESLEELEGDLSELPVYQASDEVVAATLLQVEKDQSFEDSTARSLWMKRLRHFTGQYKKQFILVAGIFVLVLWFASRSVDLKVLIIHNALLILEGSFGALFMIVLFLMGITFACFARFKRAAFVCTLGLACFVVRSTTTTFFSESNISDGHYSAGSAGSGGGEGIVYNDMRVSRSTFPSWSNMRWPWSSVLSSKRGSKKASRVDRFDEIGQAISEVPEDLSTEHAQKQQLGREQQEAYDAYKKEADAEMHTAEIFAKIIDKVEQQEAAGNRPLTEPEAPASEAGFKADFERDEFALNQKNRVLDYKSKPNKQAKGKTEAVTTNAEEVRRGDLDDYHNGQTASYASGTGLSAGADERSKLVERKAGERIPAVQVFSGREAAAVFSKQAQVGQDSKRATLSPGDTVRVELLAGLSAPTDGTPYPVIFKVTSPILAPDGAQIPLAEARLIAAAQGSLVDQRVLFRLTQLSMRFPDGRRKVVNVDGWIVGEDGIRGMQGTLTQPLAKLVTANGLDAQVDSKAQGVVARLLSERSQTDGLTFQAAEGYWANTYIPGDPALRLLEQELRGADRSWLKRLSQQDLKLDDLARQYRQPFDLPQNSALAVYVHTDRVGLKGEKRMLLQVGLQATERQAGTRPAMNVGIVLDLRGNISTETAAKFRAVLEAFAQVHDVGDRFSLSVAGKPGAMLIKPGEFRHGTISTAVKQLFEQNNSAGETLSLDEALLRATESVQGADDPNAPLGSSAVMLITSQALGESTEKLSLIAHKSAVSGIPHSVLALGANYQLAQHEQYAISGQGNRRVLQEAAQARKLVQEELSAVSRVVARAVRLRIRLAPGVKLVGILGSKRFDEVQAERVREAEKSIDVRLSKNLGIEADRGEDEEGIQIVIPSFYAADSHVILLDVVAPGPGPLVDVSARYKDLAFLRNGVARAHLALTQKEGPVGPLELNVLKNYLAHLLSKGLLQAGDSVSKGDDKEARQLVEHYLQLFQELSKHYPGLLRDTDISNDEQMLKEYLSLLQPKVLARIQERSTLANSLRFAGRLKLLPRPKV